VGTSPFIAAGQFGHRSLIYYERFYGKPHRVREVLEASYEAGVRAVQCLPFKHIVEAVLSMRKQGYHLEVWGSLMPKKPEQSLKVLERLEPKGVAIHGETSDKLNRELVTELIRVIRELGCKAGLAIHSPGVVVPWLIKERVDVDFIMVPFNKASYFMDMPAAELCKLLRQLGIPVIAMKVLAAGRLKPEEAIEFVANYPEITAIALGVASVNEALETFTVALRLFR